MMQKQEIHHGTCPAGAHTWDADDPHYEGRVDEHGNLMCNDDCQPMFYCTTDEWYHHAGADAVPCFMIRDGGYDISERPCSEHCYQMDAFNRYLWTCIRQGHTD